MIRGISHVAFDVADMEKSIDFYCGVLGFQDAFELKDEAGNPWIRYIKVANNQFIELFYNRKGENLIGSYSHICLEVEDVIGIANHLKTNKIVLDSEPTQAVDKNWQCWAKDPDGNRIEFMQMNPESPQCKA